MLPRRNPDGSFDFHKYSLYEPKGDTSLRETESALLKKLGVNSEPQELDLADAYHVMQYAATDPKVNRDLIYSAETREIIAQEGYNWRTHKNFKDVSPETALYLDAFARLHELSNYVIGYGRQQKQHLEQQALYNKVRGGYSQ